MWMTRLKHIWLYNSAHSWLTKWNRSTGVHTTQAEHTACASPLAFSWPRSLKPYSSWWAAVSVWPKNIKLEAVVPFIRKVSVGIKGTADKHSHIAIWETAVLFLLLFISAVVIAVASLGPVSGSQISVLAGSLWVQPGPLSLKKYLILNSGTVDHHGNLCCAANLEATKQIKAFFFICEQVNLGLIWCLLS